MWKKKYFREKKITAPLEQHVTQSSTNLDKIHKKIIQTIDNECKNQVQMGNSKEAETGVRKILILLCIKYHFVIKEFYFTNYTCST
jgi:hemerythrin